MQPIALSVNDRKILIFDHLLREDSLQKISVILQNTPYRRNEIATPDSEEIKHHSIDLQTQHLEQLGLLGPSNACLALFDSSRSYKIFRQYVNVCFFGDLLLPHRDSELKNNDVTALWYLNPLWKREWGGETLFYDEVNGASVAVENVPGRLVLFDGKILHAGKAPNRNCYQGRMTLAIKYYPIPG